MTIANALRAAEAKRRRAIRLLNTPALIADSTRGGDSEARKLLDKARDDLQAADAAIAILKQSEVAA